jgi:hypothetical protein
VVEEVPDTVVALVRIAHVQYGQQLSARDVRLLCHPLTDPDFLAGQGLHSGQQLQSHHPPLRNPPRGGVKQGDRIPRSIVLGTTRKAPNVISLKVKPQITQKRRMGPFAMTGMADIAPKQMKSFSM